MHGHGSLDDAIRQAGRARPHPLPPGFSLGVMERLAARSAMVIGGPPAIALTACAAVVVAAAVSLLAPGAARTDDPPPLAVFGAQVERSPFINP